VLSLFFTFTYATLAAKSRRAERLLVPLLDILQSVPILGFISITVVFFMSLAPGRVLGAEFASIFAIFTSQAWNMAFSFYQSLRTVPTELEEAARNFRLSAWMRFWRLDVPFAMPQLIWNMMMSMSGSWFFVVASEAISVGNTTVTLPGIGSYIALAIERRNLAAVCWAIGTMLVVILIYDQVLFRPLVAWADRFRFEQEPGVPAPQSWVFDVLRRSRIIERLTQPVAGLWRLSLRRQKNDKAPAGALAKRAGRHHHGAWLCHARARGCAHRGRDPDLGADRGVGRNAAARCQFRAADSAISCGIPGQPPVSDCGLGHRRLAAQSEYLA
jgi:NitT/TauT family transport system permease protein